MSSVRAFPLAALALAMACGTTKDATKDAAKDTTTGRISMAAPPATIRPTVLTDEEQMLIAAQTFGIVGAASVRADRQMLTQLYKVDAVLFVGDSAIRGSGAIATAMASVGNANSLRDFSRTSTGRALRDGTVLVDSGSYVMVSKRPGADSLVERGRYRTELIRGGPDGRTFVIQFDSLVPDPRFKGRARR